MKVLITGGLGFIGSSLAKEFIGQGHDVIVVDNLATNIIEVDEIKTLQVEFIPIDLSNMIEDDVTTLDNIIAQVDIIYHLAGSVGVKYIDMSPEKATINNFNMNQNLFPLFEKHQKKVIFGSTSEVYGNSQDAKETDALTIGPSSQLRWGYACNKLMSEFLFTAHSFPFVVCRFFNITGKGQVAQNGMVLPSLIQKAKDGFPLKIYGDGQQIRCFCDIRDCVNSLTLLAQTNIFDREVVNIGNEKNQVSILELALSVKNIMNKELEIDFIPFAQEFSKHMEDINIRIPNTEKLQKIYTCKYSLTNIIESMLN